MYACISIPAFPLAVLLHDDHEASCTPTVLVGSTSNTLSTETGSTRRTQTRESFLLAVNPSAARKGITPGLSATRALARCPQLTLRSPDPLLETRHQAALRDYLASLGPDFEEVTPGTFLLDLLTLPQALSTPLDWIEQALRKATPLRLPLHLVFAPTPDLALLAIHSPTLRSSLAFHPEIEIHVQPATTLPVDTNGKPTSREEAGRFKRQFGARMLAELPLSALLSGPHLSSTSRSTASLDLDLLGLWGLQTLGDLAALPSQGLAERLGPEAARLHDILHGKHHRLLTLHRPPQHFQLSQELEHALETLEPLLFLLRRGLETLCARLSSSQRAAIAARLTLTFDDGNLHLRDLTLPEPTCAPSTLLRLLHTHLDTVRAPAPVVAWSLQLTPTLPAESQHHLFERSLRDPNKFADTLARLEALLGSGRLGTPHPLDTHKPDSFTLQHSIFHPQGLDSNARETQHRETGTPSPAATALPLKRFRPAIKINVAAEPRGRFPHPLALLTGPHRGPIEDTHGPFPLSGHWWDPQERWQRVEWDLQLTNKTLLRLAHEPPHEWFLEGIYG